MLSSMLEIMHAKGNLMLMYMDAFNAYEFPMKILQAGNTGIIICCLWIVVLLGIFWSLWLETNATSTFWSSTSSIFKSLPLNGENLIITNLPVRMPRTVDRRSSSFAKLNLDPSDQV
jgi:hypothetical protein